MTQNHKYTRKRVKNIISDIPTRWNSVFFLLERTCDGIGIRDNYSIYFGD